MRPDRAQVTRDSRAQRGGGWRRSASASLTDHLRTAYWFATIKTCRLLLLLRLPAVAEALARVTGLRDRLVALIEAPAAD